MGITRALGYAAALAAIPLGGCDNGSPKVTKLDIDLLKDRIDLLDKRATTDEAQAVHLRMRALPIAIMTMGTKGFSIGNSDIGPLTYQMLAVEPQGGSSRVKLKIGNPTTANITRMTLEGSWGRMDADGNADFQNEHPFKATIDQTIPSATWSTRYITLDGAKPSEVGFLSIERTSIENMTLVNGE